jgi:hypothetical protein
METKLFTSGHKTLHIGNYLSWVWDYMGKYLSKKQTSKIHLNPIFDKPLLNMSCGLGKLTKQVSIAEGLPT